MRHKPSLKGTQRLKAAVPGDAKPTTRTAVTNVRHNSLPDSSEQSAHHGENDDELRTQKLY